MHTWMDAQSNDKNIILLGHTKLDGVIKNDNRKQEMFFIFTCSLAWADNILSEWCFYGF